MANGMLGPLMHEEGFPSQHLRNMWEFITPDPIEDVVKPRYFDTFADTLKRGDLIFVEAESKEHGREFAICVVAFHDTANGVLTRDLIWPKGPAS